MRARQHDDRVALVTGANKGIGKEVARRLAAEGMTVYLGARDEGRGQAAVQDLSGDVRFVQLDVTDQGQVEAAAKQVNEDFGRLDVLVNNAGIAVEWGVAVDAVAVEQVRRTYEVNVFGVIAVTRAFLPLLRRASSARIINLSSPMGSLSLLSDPSHPIAAIGMLAYSSSKAALNAVTLLYANALRDADIVVNAVSPGYVATDLNDHQGRRTVNEGADIAVRLALQRDGGSGAFLESADNRTVEPVPW
jgi:NAD(P)-dependent dehydrogenase (short-subunit alcohol dehydrogenase family)